MSNDTASALIHPWPYLRGMFELKNVSENNFFVTTRPRPTTAAVDSPLVQLQKYLQQPVGDIITLQAYPDLKNLSIKLNTPLAASAACERLFSCAGQIFTPRRSSISDTNFESQLLLKLNKKYLIRIELLMEWFNHGHIYFKIIIHVNVLLLFTEFHLVNNKH
jgi:hypothetical protein